MHTLRFCIERAQPDAPRLALARQTRMAVAIGCIAEELMVDERGDGDRQPGVRLRHNARSNRVECCELLSASENLGSDPMREARIDHPPRLCVPRGRVTLREHIVSGKPAAFCAVQASGCFLKRFRAASAASARPVKLGGAGSGGPFRTFWLQLRQPPILRETP